MVKFGKEFKRYQVTQWKESYINYKLLKQEIKAIKKNIEESKSNNSKEEISGVGDIGHDSIKPMDLAPDESIVIEVAPLTSLYNLPYGNELKRFVDLLESEFRKSYIHFVSQEKELYKKVNGHCYVVDAYKEYNLFGVVNEIKELTLTMKLARQLNSFINDNVWALKKILKKFDKKFQGYFGIIAPKYILSHLTSQNSDLEYLLQFKVIDEATTVCENNLNILLNKYNNLRKNNNVNVDIDNNDDNNNDNNNNINVNLDKIDSHLNTLKDKIYEYLDRIDDDLTYFKIQYREWFYYAKHNDRLVKNNPKIFENDIYNPVLSSTYYKDSLLEKCISSKRASKEVEHSQSPLSHSNTTNLKFIYLQAVLYGTMLTNILPIISNIYDSSLFIVPLICTYAAYLLPYIFFIYIDKLDKTNFYLNISYYISYSLLIISSLLLIFVKDKSNNNLLIIISRILLGLANNQMMNKKYITLYLPKFHLSSVSKKYLLAELIGLIIGPFVTLIPSIILKILDKILEDCLIYNQFNILGYYGLIFSVICLVIHLFFFIKPLSSDFFMVKNESNINGNKYYQQSEDEIMRNQYLKEQNMMYKQTYNEIKKKQNIKDDNNDLLINVKTKDNNDENTDIINTDNLEEKLIDNGEKINNIANDDENNNLDVIGGGNIALNKKQQDMINEIEKVLEKRNEVSNFNDMNQIPKVINSITNKEKKSLGYINKNLLLLLLLFFISSLVKVNTIFNFLYLIKKYILNENKEEPVEEEDENDIQENIIACLLILLLGAFQIIKIFFIFPFYQVNNKYKIFTFLSLLGIIVFNILSLVIKKIDENNFLLNFASVIIYILTVLACNVIDISSSCYLSFLLSPEWKLFGKNTAYYTNYMIIGGKIMGGIICILLFDNYTNYLTILLICLPIFTFYLYLSYFTRNIKIKGITRVIRKNALEMNLDN